jgi:hypothetical protein
MKVYNLTCHLDHRFEGWFASETDALEQQENGLLICPICESKEITRLPSAPRISKGATEKAPVTSDLSAAVVDGNSMVLSAPEQAKLQAQVQATVMKAMRELINKTEDVGDNFAEEARKIHYREAPERSIRGHATQDETAELREEGIEVVALPILPVLKDTLQ